MALLGILGYAPILDHEAQTLDPLDPGGFYEYRVEQGPVRVTSSDAAGSFSGSILSAVGRQEFSDAAVLQAANRLLRDVIAYHLDGKELKSRKVLLELRRTRRIHDNAGQNGQPGSVH
jgi:DNA repair protein RecO (recombination protein O)